MLGNALAANAATTASTATTAPSTGAPPGGTTSGTPTFRGLDQSGKVAAVGTASVTIGTTTYVVDAGSDIDKNGEATLSSLGVGDAVTFDSVTTGGRLTIDKLHAGNESLDMPQGMPTGGYG